MRKRTRVALWVVAGLAVALAAAQLVPYGRDHTNPPVTAEYGWRSAEARAVARGACYDCHSNETVWPWYAKVAPASWLVQRDVDEGRSRLNFSEWAPGSEVVAAALGREIAEVVAGGEMPPFQYRILHGSARLSDAQRQLLIDEFGAPQ